MSFSSFKKYLKRMNMEPFQFDKAYEKMKEIANNLIASTCSKIKRKQYTFEVNLL